MEKQVASSLPAEIGSSANGTTENAPKPQEPVRLSAVHLALAYLLTFG